MDRSDAEPKISKESKALCTEYANASFDCGQHGDNRGASWQEVFAASEKARLAVESRIAELEQAIERLSDEVLGAKSAALANASAVQYFKQLAETRLATLEVVQQRAEAAEAALEAANARTQWIAGWLTEDPKRFQVVIRRLETSGQFLVGLRPQGPNQGLAWRKGCKNFLGQTVEEAIDAARESGKEPA